MSDGRTGEELSDGVAEEAPTDQRTYSKRREAIKAFWPRNE
jgi:hypothetical protein